jgi:hypothetical protein
MPSIIDNKDKSVLLTEFIEDYFPPDNKKHQIRKLAIQVRCTEDIVKSFSNLEASINKTAESSEKLSKKVFYLNFILTVATVVAAAATVLALFK